MLKIRVHGYKNQNGKSVKSSVKLEGTVNAEESFFELSVEETLSETVLNQWLNEEKKLTFKKNFTTDNCQLITTQWARKFKKVQAKKTREIK